jgi:hypothetical protein
MLVIYFDVFFDSFIQIHIRYSYKTSKAASRIERLLENRCR